VEGTVILVDPRQNFKAQNIQNMMIDYFYEKIGIDSTNKVYPPQKKIACGASVPQAHTTALALSPPPPPFFPQKLIRDPC
jgi:hypothetical protein